MEPPLNRVTWLGIHMFLLPCNERAALANAWVSENPPDIAHFKQAFPDAMSTCGLIPSNDTLQHSMCSAKCTLHEVCLLPQRQDETAQALHIAPNGQAT